MSLQTHLQESKVHNKNYLLLLVICLLSYWPLTMGIFSVKNDAIHYFLPYRFNISEAIQHGEWPFWSPYIYLGNPIYGDMQSGAWNPIVWLFSLFGRYDLTVFHYENLLYIFLGGVGMYKLVNRLNAHAYTALLIAIAYMLSGFMLGGQLINWLASAAFIPFVFLYYLRLTSSGKYSDAVKAAIALFFLFTAGYPSFFIITCYILLVLFIIKVIDASREKTTAKEWTRFLSRHCLLLLVFAGLSAPAIISFTDLLPYYARGKGATYYDTIQNSFEWQHLRSLLFPSSIKATDLVSATDVTCRNLYTGLFSVFILAAFPPKLSRRNILLIALGVLALLFSLGDATPIRKLCYQFIPLMDSFRHPSQMRLFVVLTILLLAAPGLKKLLTSELNPAEIKRMKIIAWTSFALILLITLITFVPQWNKFRLPGLSLNTLDNLQLTDVILINGLIQSVFLIGFLWWLKKKRRHAGLFSFLWIANLFVMAQLVLPVTFVGKTSPKEINALIHQSPKGFPTTGLDRSLAENSKDAFAGFNKIALAYFYNKKIGISKIANSPAFLEMQEQFLLNDKLYDYVASQPVVYLADSLLGLNMSRDAASQSNPCNYAFVHTDMHSNAVCNTTDTAIIKKISANQFEIETTTSSISFLVLTQNYHHNWKASEDGVDKKIIAVNKSFMGIPVSAGKHTIIFRFSPGNTLKGMWLQAATVLCLLTFGGISFVRSKQKK